MTLRDRVRTIAYAVRDAETPWDLAAAMMHGLDAVMDAERIEPTLLQAGRWDFYAMLDRKCRALGVRMRIDDMPEKDAA